MAVPTIAAISPATGHSGGQTYVQITGTNFALPPAPPAFGPTTAPAPSMAVTIGGAPATAVRVLSATTLWCRTPSGDPTDASTPAAAVVVQNLDSAGAPISGELATKATAFTYVRPVFTIEAESDFARLVRTLLRELKRQIHPTVVLTTSTEYDADSGDQLNTATLASLPGLVLVGPELQENKFYATPNEVERPIDPTDPDSMWVTTRPPVTVDVHFEIVGVSDTQGELLNLLAATRIFFQKNSYLVMARSPTDATQGTVPYELAVETEFHATTQVNNSNVLSFSGKVYIRAFDLEEIAGLPLGSIPGLPGTIAGENIREHGLTVSDAGVLLDEPQQTAVSYAVGPSPGDGSR